MSKWWEQATPVKRWHLLSFLPFRPVFPAILLKTRNRNITSRWTSGKMGTKASLSFGDLALNRLQTTEKYSFVAAKVQEWVLAVLPNSPKQRPNYQHLTGRLCWELPLGPGNEWTQWRCPDSSAGWLVWATGLFLITPDMSLMEQPGPGACPATADSKFHETVVPEKVFFPRELIQKSKRLLGKKTLVLWLPSRSLSYWLGQPVHMVERDFLQANARILFT